MKAYSRDLRERVVRAVDHGEPGSQIVRMVGVSRATIKGSLKQRRALGHVRPKALPGRAPRKGAALQAGLLAQLEAHPDASIETHGELWQSEHGMGVSTSTMSRMIERVGWTRKKSRWQKVQRHEEERTSWREQRQEWEAKQLVFVDECGSNIALTPWSARAPKGQRATDSVPGNRGKNTRLIASLSLEGIAASMIIEGAAHSAAFEAYVEHILVKSLQKGHIVVMDTVRVHKPARVRQLIEEQGCPLRFLPAYSPDFSPLEEAFSKLKTALRRSTARRREALEEAIAHGLLTLTSQDADGWFEHGGYLPAAEMMS